MSNRFTRRSTALSGVVVLDRSFIGDDRGFLDRMYCADELRDLIQGRTIVQVNRTLTTRRGTVRGMHFQHTPHAELKVVTCLRGEVLDVAVDLRAGSPTLLHSHAERLGGSRRTTMIIPEGCAHGFQALTDDCEMLYFHTAAYHPASEGGIRPTDPRLGIAWPLEITDISARDAMHPLLGADFPGISL